MIDEKSLKLIETQFNKQINFLDEIKHILETVKNRSEQSIRNPEYDSSIRRNCLKEIASSKKNLKKLISENKEPFEILKEIKKTIPLNSIQLKIIEDFPHKLETLYFQINEKIFNTDKSEEKLSLNSLLDNRYYSLELIIEKCSQIIQIISEAKSFIFQFLINLKENENKIISLQSEKENFRVDFNNILKQSGINLQRDQVLIFDSNFLIHYLEDQRIAQRKKEYRFFFPQNSKIITFEKNSEESNHKIFGNSKSIKKLVKYLESLQNAERFTNVGNKEIKDSLFNIWLSTGLGKIKDQNKFYKSLDMDILEFCSKVANLQIIIFSSDPDIIKVVNTIRSGKIRTLDSFANKTFNNIRIVSFKEEEEKRTLKLAA